VACGIEFGARLRDNTYADPLTADVDVPTSTSPAGSRDCHVVISTFLNRTVECAQ